VADAADGFCCPGCAAAFEAVKGLGLESYYRRRVLDPEARPMRPDAEPPRFDFGPYVTNLPEGRSSLTLAIDGLHCAACVWLIESVLARMPGVVTGRVNMTTRRLRLVWRTGEADPRDLVGRILSLGYRLTPFDEAAADDADAERQRMLLRAMAVAGFAAGNIMLLSVSVWAGYNHGMGPATRDLMHWISALIAVPTVAYAGQPFFRPAMAALSARRVNMNVPISLAVILATGMSLVQTATSQPHAYFDSAVMLLFFLLVGRYLDARSRGQARSVAANILALRVRAVTVVGEDGATQVLAPAQVKAGMSVLVATGERIPVDGRVESGASDVDTAAITGESVPRPVRAGDRVMAGTVNLTGPLRVTVDSVGDETILAEILRLVETAEQGRARYVALADRVARLYAPAVHSFALATFAGWLILGAGWQDSLLTAIAVLIITCPCALALAVPAVQVAAAGRLLRGGVLVKSETALERLAEVDTIVFDKTGTLTKGQPLLIRDESWSEDDLAEAAALAASSRHPLARALARAAGNPKAAAGVEEIPGSGLRLGETRLGSREWCDAGAAAQEPDGPELWFARPGRPMLRFAFRDEPRADAEEVVAALLRDGYRVELLSGDRPAVAGAMAGQLGIAHWRGGSTPAAKAARLRELAEAGRRVCMVGDGLNDAPALGLAHVSLSPAEAMEIAQNAADAVFQGDRLRPVLELLTVSRRANRLVLQNLAFSFAYNAITIPLAMAGFVTPIVAAAAMSGSSIVVVTNALRLSAGRRR
jgi:Cu2+-exporting ATPase